MEALYREWIYLWYYCSIQFHQIFPYWVAGMVIGSLVSVFLKKHIHALMAALQTHSIGICGSGGFTTTSNLAMMNFPLLAYLDEISPRPILFVVGDRAHSKFFSENACAAAKEPKELYTVADAEHIDLYDRRDRIPFDKLAEFFSSNLK